MIHRTGSHCHIKAVHAMRNINIINIFSDITSLNVIILNIRHSHNNNICIHLHHKCYKFLFPYIIRFNLTFFFCNSEYLIIWITCYIMNCNIRIIKYVFNYPFKILIEA